MTLRVSGKNIDVGEALRNHIGDQIDAAVSKYFDGGYTGHVIVEKEASNFKTECKIHLDTGIDLVSNGIASDAHPSFDLAAERIEKRLRRYKRRLKDHRASGNAKMHMAPAYVLAGPTDEEEEQAGSAPAIIAENETTIRTMTVSTAVMAMDLSNQDVYVFRNPDNGEINVLHKRDDGNIGWIDPSQN